MRKPFIRSLLSRAAALAVVGFTLAVFGSISGCGVGVGGTGTGEDLSAFGATASSVCNAPVAAALNCPGATTSPPSVGSARKLFVDVDSGGRVLVTIDGNQIEFEARCTGLSFTGTWGTGIDGKSRYFGNVVNNADRSRQLALIDIAMLANQTTSQLLAMLKDASERPLMPTVALRAVQTLPAVLPTCP